MIKTATGLPADTVIFDNENEIIGVTATASGRTGDTSVIVSGVVHISVPSTVRTPSRPAGLWLKKTLPRAHKDGHYTIVTSATVQIDKKAIVGRILKISPSHGGRKEVCVRLP